MIDLLVGLATNHPSGRSPIELLAEPFGFVSTLAARPVVSPATRYFLAHGWPTMTRRHDTGDADDGSRFVLQQFDGSRTVDDVAEMVLGAHVAGSLNKLSGSLEYAASDRERMRLTRRDVETVAEVAMQSCLIVG